MPEDSTDPNENGSAPDDDPEAGAEDQEEAPPPHPVVEALLERFPDAVSDEGSDRIDVPIVRVDDAADLLEVMRWLRTDDATLFDYLASLTAVDWTERSPRFDVVYNLTSLQHHHRLTVKVGCEDGGGVPSVSEIWRTADWHEREAYDLYGVEFLGHPNLERIFLPEDWEGYPLRKDYPLEGPNLELLTRQQAAFRGGRFDRIRGDYEMSEQERQMAGAGVVGTLWTPPEPDDESNAEAGVDQGGGAGGEMHEGDGSEPESKQRAGSDAAASEGDTDGS